MRIVLVDRLESGDLPTGQNRFGRLAALLAQHGHDVVLRDNRDLAPPLQKPFLTGLNRAASTRPLLEAHALAVDLAPAPPHLLIAPLRGGIAQGVLMARACDEAFARTRVAVWCDTPSRDRFLRSDGRIESLAPLIADALERQTAALADAFIAAPDRGETLPAWAAQLRPTFQATLPGPPDYQRPPAADLGSIHEIAFVGALRRSSGICEFVEAMQQLSHDGLLADRTVVLVGRTDEETKGVGKEWLGLRAANWSFRFKVVDEDSAEAAQRLLAEPSRLGVAIADDAEELSFLQGAARPPVALLRQLNGPLLLVERLEARLRAALTGHPVQTTARPVETDWRGLTEQLSRVPIQRAQRRLDTSVPQASSLRAAVVTLGRSARRLWRRRSRGGVSVCVLHHNRLAELETALASIPATVEGRVVELIVIDNGSEIPDVEAEIRRLAGPRKQLRVLRISRPVPQPHALNLGLAKCRFETVLFLDDDNSFLPSGVARLAKAIDGGRFDIVVTSLEIFDPPPPGREGIAGRLLFLGDAHSAGLFFNAFGDTTMAVKRGAFLRLGGFHDPGHDYPSLDWVTLAKARAAGLRIGALQWPAVRYRRDFRRAELSANKIDQEGARWFVFDAYAGTYDPELVARFAQKVHLDEP